MRSIFRASNEGLKDTDNIFLRGGQGRIICKEDTVRREKEAGQSGSCL